MEKITKEEGRQTSFLCAKVNSLAGQAVGGIKTVEPAQKIVDDMINEA